MSNYSVNYTIESIMQMLPIFDIDECNRVFFKDRSISEMELYFDIGVNEFQVVPIDYYKRILKEFTVQLYYCIYDSKGWLMVHNDTILSDLACMGLYEHDINVVTLMLVDNKNLYDRPAIERRMIIKNIIEHE